MLKDITLGQYYPVKSPVHKLDARVKILLSIAFMVAVFCVKAEVSYVVLAVFTAAMIKLSKIPFRFMLKGIKPIMFFIVFTAVLNVFLTGGTPIWQLGFLKITREGLSYAALMVIRIVFLVFGTSLLTYTTSPIQLTDGLEALLRPFSKIGLPSHELAMMMSIALRFIPTLLEETDKIMKAQTARGADFESGNIVKRAKALIPLLVPLFISAFRRADELATAMECRCYHGGNNRTKLHEPKLCRKDLYAVLVFVVFVVVITMTNIIF